MSQRSIHRRAVISAVAALSVTGFAFVGFSAPPAQAAGETANVWLTTTSDAGGRTVTRGLQQQTPVTFAAGTGGSGTNITVNDATKYQQFTGGGASMTDSAGWLLNSGGLLSAATRDAVMQKLFSYDKGIGISLLRNPMGASDLARSAYSYDDGGVDPNLNNFTVQHDTADVLPLTKQALSLNPALTVMGSPWSAPGWMKDTNTMLGGHLQAQYYGTYASYFVKYLQEYAKNGVKVSLVTPQNEPGVNRADMPSMGWDANGLDYFVGSELLPKLHAAGLSTKVVVHDWNPADYDATSAQTVNDAAVRNDSLFGGIAWHDYGGSLDKITTVHNQYPAVDMYGTEISGGTWVTNQQHDDMLQIVNFGRNWAKSYSKWGLALDQNHSPHLGGCDTCTGLVTVHNRDGRNGQVDYTIEYYSMGHLTKFVRPGAYRVDSTASSDIPNVAYLNPDGTRALIAYNTTASTQTVRVNWSGQNFTYALPTRTAATFTWKAGTTTTPPAARTGAVKGLAGKCLEVPGANTANGTVVQLRTCNNSSAQTWTVGTDGSLRALGNKCLDVVGNGTSDGTAVQIWDCTGGAAQKWTYSSANQTLTNPQAAKCLDVKDNTSTDGTPLQVWTCTGAANQKWVLPT